MISLTTLIYVASAVAIKALASITLGPVVNRIALSISHNTLLGKGHCTTTFGIQKVVDHVATGSFQLLQAGPSYNQFTQQ